MWNDAVVYITAQQSSCPTKRVHRMHARNTTDFRLMCRGLQAKQVKPVTLIERLSLYLKHLHPGYCLL